MLAQETNIKMKLTLLSTFAMIALAGCGGNSAIGPNAFAFDNLETADENFMQLNQATSGLSSTFAENLPAAGVSTYDGMMAILLPNDDNVIGTIRLHAEFSDNNLSGQAGSFLTADNQPTVGSLSFTGGDIPSAGVADGTVDVSGQIEFLAGPMSVDETFGYRFVGDTGEFITGDLQFGDVIPESGDPILSLFLWTAARQ